MKNRQRPYGVLSGITKDHFGMLRPRLFWKQVFIFLEEPIVMTLKIRSEIIMVFLKRVLLER